MSHPHEHTHAKPAADGKYKGIETVEHLVEHLAEIACDSMVIVCVGNDLNGDDGAGVAVARRLAGRVPWRLFDTQGVPESFLMKIVDARPDVVLLVDALEFGAAAGAVELVATDKITGQGPSTHGPAPLAFLELLNMMHPCRCAVLGIQPQTTEPGAPLSEPVRAGVDLIVAAFERLSHSRGAAN